MIHYYNVNAYLKTLLLLILHFMDIITESSLPSDLILINDTITFMSTTLTGYLGANAGLDFNFEGSEVAVVSSSSSSTNLDLVNIGNISVTIEEGDCK